MQIYLNGQIYPIATSLMLTQLLAQLELTGRRLAVEVNEQIIPKSQQAQYQLQDGDRVEIVHAIGGG